MAIAANALTSGHNNNFGTSTSTASVSPGANRLQLLAVININEGGSAATPSASGNGLTWVQVQTATFVVGGNTRRVTVFRAMGASPSSGAVSLSFGSNQDDVIWSLVEFSGVDTGGSNGSAAVAQSKTGSSNSGTAAALSLDSAMTSGSATYGAAVDASNTNSGRTPGSGYTELHDIGDFGENFSAGIETEYRLDGQTSVAATMLGAGWALVGIEIKAPSAASSSLVDRAVIGRGVATGMGRGMR